MPESRVRPPACTLVTVRIVAPAPGRPPSRALAMLPMPWPINSWSESCWLRVMLSATREVSSESMEPNTARVSAKPPRVRRSPHPTWGHCSAGRPVGMAPSLGRAPLGSHSTEAPLTTTSATRGAGSRKFQRLG